MTNVYGAGDDLHVTHHSYLSPHRTHPHATHPFPRKGVSFIQNETYKRDVYISKETYKMIYVYGAGDNSHVTNHSYLPPYCTHPYCIEKRRIKSLIHLKRDV